MKNFFKRHPIQNLTTVLASTFLCLVFLEIIFRAIGAPGAGRYIETIVLESGLKPRKPRGELRVFTYGESTMRGAHYSSVSSPARWLELYLKDLLPDQTIRVVDFSRLGAGSDFVYRSFRETQFYQPDLAVFYMGHNTFLNRNRKDQVELKQKRLSRRLDHWSRKSYLISTIYRRYLRGRVRLKQSPPADPFEFETIERAPPGVRSEDIVLRDTPEYLENLQFFRDNISGILDAGKKRRIPILFFKPICNLKDFAPSYSVHMKELSPEDLKRWERLYEEGKAAQGEDKGAEALRLFTEAHVIDPTYADLSFRLGQIYFTSGDFKKAREIFEEARDHDAAITRATEDILNVFTELEKHEALQLMDTERVLAPEVPSGILGEPVVEDNVHLSIKGHSLLARLAVEETARRNWLEPRSAWKFEAERPFGAMVGELGIDTDLLFWANLKMAAYFGSRFENRLRFAQKALEIYPDHPSALRHLAWTYWLMGEKGKALAIYRKLEPIDPEALQDVFSRAPAVREVFERRSLTEPLDALDPILAVVQPSEIPK